MPSAVGRAAVDRENLIHLLATIPPSYVSCTSNFVLWGGNSPNFTGALNDSVDTCPSGETDEYSGVSSGGAAQSGLIVETASNVFSYSAGAAAREKVRYWSEARSSYQKGLDAWNERPSHGTLNAFGSDPAARLKREIADCDANLEKLEAKAQLLRK